LHRFRDTAFDRSKITIWLPLLGLNPLMEGFPWDDLHTIFHGRQWTAKVPNGIETLWKISTGWVRRMSITVRRQTDGRAIRHIANIT